MTDIDDLCARLLHESAAYENERDSAVYASKLFAEARAAIESQRAEIARLEGKFDAEYAASQAVMRECDALRARAEAAEKEAARWRVVRDRMRHMRCGPNVGWGLDELYPGDDPDSAIDAVAAPEGET